MRISFLDLESLPAQPQSGAPAGDPAFGKSPQRVASTALLCQAAAARAAGHAVSYHYVDAAQRADPATFEPLRGSDRLIVRQPGGALPATLTTQAADPIEVFDPWSPRAAWIGLPAYDLATGQRVTLAETEAAPTVEPSHPWVCPSLTSVPVESAESRIAAAAAALAGAREGQIYLNDERVRLDMQRLRFLAEQSRAALRDHKTLIELHVRAWPGDLLGERILEHLSLLPVASLDVLAGSLREGSLRQMDSQLTSADVLRCLAEVLRSGLAHLCRLSIVLGLPGETANDCATAVNDALRIALAHRIARLRFSFWLGKDAAGIPANAEAHERQFLAAHPDWHAIEYRGIQDFVALSALAHPQLKVVGPSL